MVPPDTNLLPVRVAGERTVVMAVPVWLLVLLSKVLDVTVAELVRTDPAATVGATATFNVKTALPTENEAFEQETVPLSPGAGAVQDHPTTSGKDTKVVPAGRVSLHDAFAAASGPLLFTVMV